ncbi:hypothetical protein [Corynebacterium sp. KPL4043]|uniref:hypothetical protein n=1 Tax=Corynebacterium sp. KPL4043 TaxID=3158328 RepID=UPI0020668EB9|nr:MAG TPA: hypothetical protein [Caudoviricetes sp.]
MGRLNPTRQEIHDAHKALQKLLVYALTWGDDTTSELYRELYGEVLAALPPLPRPTMAEIEWDEETHYLAEAEHPYQGKVLMLGKSFFSGRICITRAKENGALWSEVKPETLTPTGRSFELTEVQE